MGNRVTRYRVPAFTYAMTPKTRKERDGKPYPDNYRIVCATGARYWGLPNAFGALKPIEKRRWVGMKWETGGRAALRFSFGRRGSSLRRLFRLRRTAAAQSPHVASVTAWRVFPRPPRGGETGRFPRRFRGRKIY